MSGSMQTAPTILAAPARWERTRCRWSIRKRGCMALKACAWCRQLQTPEGDWQELEDFIVLNTEAEFTHGMCPGCYSRFETSHDSANRPSGRRELADGSGTR